MRGGAGAGPDCSPPEPPPKDPLPRGEGSGGGLRLSGPGSQLQLVQSQPIGPSSSGLSLGQLTLRGEERGGACPVLEGLGDTLLAFYKNQLLGASPGQRGTIFEAQTFLSMGLGPEQQLTRGRTGGHVPAGL